MLIKHKNKLTCYPTLYKDSTYNVDPIRIDWLLKKKNQKEKY